MKKVLSTVAALGLVAGLASTASALEFSATGHYDLIGTYTSQSTDGGITNDSASDAWLEHEFVIAPKMKVNDKVSMNARIFLAGTAEDEVGGAGEGIMGQSDEEGVYLHYLYMDYKSPIGMFRLGRQAAGAYFGNYLNVVAHGDRLRWYSNDLGGGFKLSAFLQKFREGSPDPASSDNDVDIWSFGGFAKSKALTYSLWLDYFRGGDDAAAPAPYGQADFYRFKGYYQQTFGDLYAMAEFSYKFGDLNEAGSEIDTLAAIGEFGVAMETLDLSAMVFYASGDDNGMTDGSKDNAMSGTYGLGSAFAPFTVLTNTDTGLLTAEKAGVNANAAMVNAGVIACGFFADVATSDSLTLHAGVGYALAESEPAGADDEYGWEVDLGLSYKLNDNLSYHLDAGYLMAGDFFGADPEDVILVTNGVSMTF
ncbi:MAG: hypothetical protein ABFR97_06945 [Thermodesulfobacteriota bacterium]